MNETKKIQRAAGIGLWGSAAAIILTVAFLYSPWRIVNANPHTVRWMTIAGVVLAVLAVSMTLLTVRKQVPALRQTEDLQTKLAGYAQYVQSVYMSMLAVVVVLCALTLLSGHNALLMLAMVSALVLILNFPNIYRVKVDLGLTDDEMRSLYGDRYIGGHEQ